MASVIGKRTRALSDSEPDQISFGHERKRSKAARQPRSNFSIHEDVDTICHDVSLQSGCCAIDSPKASRAKPFNTEGTNCSFEAPKVKKQSEEPLEDFENNSSIRLPQTPRHRDALSKQIKSTPRHRIIAASIPFNPQTPNTPSKSISSIKSVYSDARRVFDKSSNVEHLIGRQNERTELETFMKNCLDKGTGGCLYISGPPGTGKSALVSQVCNGLRQSAELRYANVNCMSIKRSEDLYETLLSQLEALDQDKDDNAELSLHKILHQKTNTTSFVVVLDEIDRLLALNMEIMYNLFAWSLKKRSRLILIGIANALDLTDRLLPRLKAHNLKPQLLPFLPYSASEIATILTSRARSLLPQDTSVTADFIPVLMNGAVQLISKKVGAQNGDLRKAFDIIQRVIELIEKETYDNITAQTLNSSPSKTPLSENFNLSSPGKSPTKSPKQARPAVVSFKALTAETAPRATLSHVIRITSSTFNNGTASRLKSLNLQQKAILCSLAAYEQRECDRRRETLPSPDSTPSKSCKFSSFTVSGLKRESGPPSMSALYEIYCNLCTGDNVLHALSRTEFRDVVGSLETLSLVSAIDGKNGSLAAPATPSKRGRGTNFGNAGKQDERRISSSVDRKELMSAVDGIGAGVLSKMIAGSM